MLVNNEILAYTEVMCIHGGKPTQDYVALAARPEHKYNKHTNDWEPTGGTTYLWGRLHKNYGTLSHMCYEIHDEHGHNPVDTISLMRNRVNSWGPDWEFWYFDAGTTMTEIKIHIDELERAFRELELI